MSILIPVEEELVSKIREYTIYWEDGSITQTEGFDTKDALQNLGYDEDQLNRIDMILCGQYDSKYEYSEVEQRWVNVEVREELSGFIK